jgi:1-phosphofructokinase family hexose kinase
MGFVGGHNGRLLADLTQGENLHSAWTWTTVETRSCTILVSGGEDATVINEPGMPVSEEDWKRLQQEVGNRILSADRVCLSGSLPPGSRTKDLDGFLEMLTGTGRQIWADTSGEALRTVLAHPGIHIKVNGKEIGDVLGVEVKDVDSARRTLKPFVERMQAACVVTLGSAGALMITQEGMWHAHGPNVQVVSTLGSGDAFLGGLTGALDGGKDWPGALCDAVAAGTANALSTGAGQFTLEHFEKIRNQVQIRSW